MTFSNRLSERSVRLIPQPQSCRGPCFAPTPSVRGIVRAPLFTLNRGESRSLRPAEPPEGGREQQVDQQWKQQADRGGAQNLDIPGGKAVRDHVVDRRDQSRAEGEHD